MINQVTYARKSRFDLHASFSAPPHAQASMREIMTNTVCTGARVGCPPSRFLHLSASESRPLHSSHPWARNRTLPSSPCNIICLVLLRWFPNYSLITDYNSDFVCTRVIQICNCSKFAEMIRMALHVRHFYRNIFRKMVEFERR